MAKKKSDYLIMLDLGEWLETYLNPNIKPWDYRELSQKALHLLSSNYLVTDDDYFLQFLNLIEKYPETLQNEYLIGVYRIFNSGGKFGVDPCGVTNIVTNVIDRFLEEVILQGKNLTDVFAKITGKNNDEILKKAINSKRFFFNKLPSQLTQLEETVLFYNYISHTNRTLQIKDKEFSNISVTLTRLLARARTTIVDNQYRDLIIRELSDSFRLRPFTLELMKEIIKAGIPWTNTMERAINDHEPFFRYGYYHLYSFVKDFSNTTERLHFKNGQVTKIKILSRENEKKFSLFPFEPPSFFPWRIVVPQIFFNFLGLGGQDYSGFCEYCGRFIVSQRKGRRKTCSNNCRQELFRRNKSS